MKKILSFALCMILVFAMPITSATAKTTLDRPQISVSVSRKHATIRINKVSGAKRYRIYMKKKCESCGGTWVRIKTTTLLRYTKKSLALGETYYFKVKAYGKNKAKSDFSKVKTVKIDGTKTAKTSVPTSGSSNIVSSTTATVSSTVYITSTGTKYHRASCGSLSKSKISISKSDAIAKGYTACARCKP